MGMEGRAMPRHCTTAMRRWVSILFGIFLVVALAASAGAKVFPLQIKVLSRASYIAPGPPEQALEDCVWRAIDGYCYNWTPTVYTVHTMTVQTNGGVPFSIACTAYRWSHCVGLPVDETFAARKYGRRIEIRYTDKDGKQRTQFYVITAGVSPSKQP